MVLRARGAAVTRVRAAPRDADAAAAAAGEKARALTRAGAQTEHFDKDERFMAISDLQQELAKDVRLDAAVEKRCARARRAAAGTGGVVA